MGLRAHALARGSPNPAPGKAPQDPHSPALTSDCTPWLRPRALTSASSPPPRRPFTLQALRADWDPERRGASDSVWPRQPRGGGLQGCALERCPPALHARTLLASALFTAPFAWAVCGRPARYLLRFPDFLNRFFNKHGFYEV